MIEFIKRFFGMGTPEEIDPNGPQNKNLGGKQFKEELAATADAILLDVRTPAEFSSGTLSGALNMDIMTFNFAQKVEKLDKTKTYFVFCRSGNRSGQACKIMHKMGFDVRNLNGGIGSFPR